MVGIDEVGRGPLAGPVAVAAVRFQTDQLRRLGRRLLAGIRDSKRLTEEARETWFARFSAARADGLCEYAVSFVTSARIDRVGIAPAVRAALARSLSKLNPDPERTLVLLDGGLRAPVQFLYQKTIVRGDATEPLIAAASIVAKVLRDRRMVRYARQFPLYGFERHKGYGTHMHVSALQQHGPCTLHRKSFCRGVLT